MLKPILHNLNMSFLSVTVARSAEFLPFKPTSRVRFPAGSGILICILVLGVHHYEVMVGLSIIPDPGFDFRLYPRPQLLKLSV